MDKELQQRSAIGCQLIADVVGSFGEVRVKVTGSSMIPAIWPGDVVVVHRSDGVELKPGEIVLSMREEKLVAHRIVYICDDSVITRGDTLYSDDPPIGKSEIVGRVICLIRYGRRVHLKQSAWQRISTYILRRSDFWQRMVLRVGIRLTRRGSREISWAS